MSNMPEQVTDPMHGLKLLSSLCQDRSVTDCLPVPLIDLGIQWDLRLNILGIEKIFQTIITKLSYCLVPKMMIGSLFYAPDVNGVRVQQEEGKEYIEIDVEGMEVNKFYIVKYDDEIYAVRKLNKYEIEFCDVIE